MLAVLIDHPERARFSRLPMLASIFNDFCNHDDRHGVHGIALDSANGIVACPRASRSHTRARKGRRLIVGGPLRVKTNRASTLRHGHRSRYPRLVVVNRELLSGDKLTYEPRQLVPGSRNGQADLMAFRVSEFLMSLATGLAVVMASIVYGLLHDWLLG